MLQACLNNHNCEQFCQQKKGLRVKGHASVLSLTLELYYRWEGENHPHTRTQNVQCVQGFHARIYVIKMFAFVKTYYKKKVQNILRLKQFNEWIHIWLVL